MVQTSPVRQAEKRARIVVVGGGYGGIAAAARLAKLDHEVILCERGARLGGALGSLEQDGYRWDTGPASMAFPAPLRDLFRKSGRPLERVADLVPLTTPRRHVLRDGTTLDLPIAGRAPQYAAINDALGRSAASTWARYVDGQEEVWELLRTRALEIPFTGAAAFTRRERRRLRAGRSLERSGRRLRDRLLTRVLGHYAVEMGSDPRRTPAFVGALAYLERTFGRWRFEGGFGVLVDALTRRLSERRVEVRTGTEVVAVRRDAGPAWRVELTDGEQLAADIVVSAVSANTLYGDLLVRPNDQPDASPPAGEAEPPELADVRRTRPAARPTVWHLGLEGPLPVLPHETVLYGRRTGEPTYAVRTCEDVSSAPPGHAAWTVVEYPSRPGDDQPGPTDDQPGPMSDPAAVLTALADRGLDLRGRVRVGLHRRPAADGLAWDGAATACLRPPNRSSLSGLYSVGSCAHPGAGLPFVALGAATVAELIGKAPRTARTAG